MGIEAQFPDDDDVSLDLDDAPTAVAVAQGCLMERFGLSAADALRLLAWLAEAVDLPLQAVARWVIDNRAATREPDGLWPQPFPENRPP